MSKMTSVFENRYFRLVVYSAATLLTSCLYYGWQQYSMLLFNAGKYEWLCPEGWNSDDGPCDDQDAKVQALYSVASGTEFSFAVIAGFMLDHMGPKISVMVGEVLWAVGFLLVAYGNQGWLLITGMALSGAAVNIIAFPTLILADLFPNHRSVMMALCLGCQTSATVVAPVLWEIWKANPSWTFPSIVWGYLLCIWLPIFLSLSVSVPFKRPVFAFPDPDTVEPSSSTTPKSHSTISAAKAADVEAAVSAARPAEAAPNSIDWKKFCWEMSRIDYLLFLVYYILNLLQFMYYPTTVRSEHGESVSEFLGWIMWSQGPIGVFLGWLCDYTGTVLISVVLVISTGLTYVLTMIPSEGLQYFTTILFSTAQSYIYTTKYTWVDELYGPANYGKLVGFIGFLAGLFTYLNIPISAISNSVIVYWVYIGVSVFLLFILGVLYIRQFVGSVSYKELEGSEDAKDAFPLENQSIHHAVSDAISAVQSAANLEHENA